MAAAALMESELLSRDLAEQRQHRGGQRDAATDLVHQSVIGRRENEQAVPRSKISGSHKSGSCVNDASS